MLRASLNRLQISPDINSWWSTKHAVKPGAPVRERTVNRSVFSSPCVQVPHVMLSVSSLDLLVNLALDVYMYICMY